ncbi:MAG TPA: hypothetical protein VKS98_04705 [Chthoniobacterales bacterium]|nr:hypothetical protein [Chthoniobacterales bacterium]
MYLLGLWIYAAVRTRLIFFWILALAGLCYLLLAIVNAALVFGPEQVRNAFGSQFTTVYAVFVLCQPFNLVLAAIGHTVLVNWVVRAAVPRHGDL